MGGSTYSMFVTAEHLGDTHRLYQRVLWASSGQPGPRLGQHDLMMAFTAKAMSQGSLGSLRIHYSPAWPTSNPGSDHIYKKYINVYLYIK